MLIREAVTALEGHGILSVKSAQAICETLNVPFDETLIMEWQTEEEAMRKYSFLPRIAPGQGVDALTLSYRVTEAFGLGAPGYCYSRVGKQAHANQQAILQYLSKAGRL